MTILPNIVFLLVFFWSLSAFVLLLLHLSQRLSLIPLIFTLGAYTAALQFRSLGLMNLEPLFSELTISIGSFILLPNILLGLLLVYIIHGSTSARNLLYGVIFISLLIAAYQVIPTLPLPLPDKISIIFSETIPSARIPLSSAITLCLDFIVLIFIYQWISNIRGRFPSKLAGCLALIITLAFDAIIFPIFAYLGQPIFFDLIPFNLLGKIISGLAIFPLFSLYLNKTPKYFPLSAASSHRSLYDIFSSREQQYENNLLKLNKLTNELAQLHDLQEIFNTVANAEEEILWVNASIILILENQKPTQRIIYTNSIDKEKIDEFIELIHLLISKKIITKNKYWTINEISKIQGYQNIRNQLLELDFQSALFLPLYRYNTISGIHVLLYRVHRNFSSAEAQLALTITNSLSIALQNSHLYQLEHHQRQFAEALVQATAVLNSTLDLDQLLERILEQTTHVVPCRSANLMLVKENKAAIVRQIQQQENGEFISLNYGPSIPLSTLTLQYMIETSGPLLISNTDSHPLWQDVGASDWISSYAAAPLQIRGETTGFLGVNSDQPNFFDQETTERLQAFASHAAVALHNARLYQHLQDHSIELENRVKERTAELSSAKNRIEVILNAVPEAVFVLDSDDKLLEANHAGEILYNQAQASGFNLFNPALLEQLKKSHLSDENSNLEFNQRSFQALASTFPIENSMSSGLIIVYQDITHFRELDDMKNQFVSDVSHELRTPLTNLRLYLDLLSIEEQTHLRQSYLNTLQRETDRLTNLIEDLLTISRIESGRTRIQIQAVNLAVLVSDLVKDREQMASQRGLELKTEFPTKFPLARVDPRSLNQVLSNLFTNAMLYTLPGGAITIAADEIETENGYWLRIFICDTGVGIPPDELPHIFDRFYRGSSSKITKADGTGLGLAISKEILERMGGKIQVESKPNEGSTFTVWLRAML